MNPPPDRPSDLPPLPARPGDAHKGSMGRVLLVGGSRGMAGAVAMAAEAALRGGAGYVVAAVPGAISPEMTAAIPSAVLRLCGGPERAHLEPGDLDGLLAEAGKAQALVAGPGMGTEADTGELLAALLAGTGLPAIVDADGLNLLALRNPCGAPFGDRLPEACVLTPHPGEAARLLGLSGAAEVQKDRAAALRALVQRTGATVLLKGAGTLVGAPGREPWTNPSGNPGMATAGSGDVLSGLVGALLARGLESWDAARLGAYLHGSAGDLAAAELGEESLIAPDLNRYLPRVLREYPRAAPC